MLLVSNIILQFQNNTNSSFVSISFSYYYCSSKESACQLRKHRDTGQIDPWVRKIPWSRKWQPTPVFLPGKFRGQRNLAGYSLWGHKESDTTWQLPKVIPAADSLHKFGLQLSLQITSELNNNVLAFQIRTINCN